jgi:hypothetical protein
MRDVPTTLVRPYALRSRATRPACSGVFSGVF